MKKSKYVSINVFSALIIFIFNSCNTYSDTYYLKLSDFSLIIQDSVLSQAYYVGSDGKLYCADEEAVSVCAENFDGTLMGKKDDLLFFLDEGTFCSLSLETQEIKELYQLDEPYSYIWFDEPHLRWIGEEGLFCVDIRDGDKIVLPLKEPVIGDCVWASEEEIYFNRYGDKSLVGINYHTGQKRVITSAPAVPYGNLDSRLFCILDGQAVAVDPHTGKQERLFDCKERDMQCISALDGVNFFCTGREKGQHIDSQNYYTYEDGEWKFLCNVPNVDSLVSPDYFQADDALYFRSFYLPEGDYIDLSADTVSESTEAYIYQYMLKTDGGLFLLSKEVLKGPLA